MVEIIYGAMIDKNAINKNIHRLINLTYKLLPIREEGEEWQKPLETIIEEFAGMDKVLIGKHELLFSLLCKLKGLTILVGDNDFFLYRRIIFECLSLMNELKYE